MIIKKLGWIAAVAAMLAGCGVSGERGHTLEEQIQSVVRDVDGTVGIAFIGNGDTVVVNNDVGFAMMSVFKLHQALAVGNAVSIDTVIGISQSELDHHTWSPMLTTYGNEDFDISVRELISHALVESDNNASNILFDRIVSPDDTERFVKSIASDTTFAIRYSEADMKRNNDLSYENYSSPLSAGLLMLQIFTTDLLPTESLEAIREDLKAVTTGKNRIYAGIECGDGTLFAHKTGSGYLNDRGELMAFNDVAYVRLPDGHDYSLAVMIRDFAGSEDEAAEIMAEIGRIAHTFFKGATSAH